MNLWRVFLLLCVILVPERAISAPPENDQIADAFTLANVNSYCSAIAAFNNTDATAGNFNRAFFWNTAGKDVWFKFTALRTDVNILVNGAITGSSNTLATPLVALYSWENNVLTEMIGSMTRNGNSTTAYKGGLTIGTTYYIRVSAENDATGTFQLCVNNYTPPGVPGQDCSSATLLCNKNPIEELSVSGAGNNNNETAGSCVGMESNAVWYQFKAANNGTLGFAITPKNQNDDIDWALYDLGVNGDCSAIQPVNLLRCAGGSGVNCTPSYYITGMNMTSADLSEAANCVTGQDGFVRYIDMIQGHTYALLVNNFSNANNGFTITFEGTGEFAGPTAQIGQTVANACTSAQEYIFYNQSANYTSLKWSFGEGASIASSTAEGPHTISYNSPGMKTVVLETLGTGGCSEVTTTSFYVTTKPGAPVISTPNSNFCIGENAELRVDQVRDATYSWTGPMGFTANTPEISFPITTVTQGGTYSVRIRVGDCESDVSTFNVNIVPAPVAAFSTDPVFPGKFSVPIPIKFNNQSQHAARYEWDFGDGQTGSELSPTHVYTRAGTYTVTLKAYNSNDCVMESSISDLVLIDGTALAVPNSFSPNGDGVNDHFNINLTNLKAYTITIFNRYGNQLFTSDSTTRSWDGTWKGQPVPVGGYFYRITGTDLFGNPVKKEGSITLIR